MRLLKAIVLAALVLALSAGAAFAKSAPPKGARLDPSFGRGGVARTATAGAEPDPVHLAVTPGGRSYVLQNQTVLAFKIDGRPAKGFAKNGRLTLATAKGEGTGTAITVDSKGRVLVAGILRPTGAEGPAPTSPFNSYPGTENESFVIRLLPNGSRDAGFGTGGEVDTTFGVPTPRNEAGSKLTAPNPVAEVTAIAVDAQDRPIIGGRAIAAVEPCPYTYAPTLHAVPLVARLTASGSPDAGFAGQGYVLGARGSIDALALAPGGELVTLSNLRLDCVEHEAQLLTSTGRLTEAGDGGPGLDPAHPTFQMWPLLAVDSQGRSLVVQIEEFSEHPGVLVRLLANGDVDPTFGHEGGVPLTGLLGTKSRPGGIVFDSDGRPIVAAGTAGVELLRLRTDGKPDSRFGPRGRVGGGAKGNADGSVGGVALDGRGRIYVASWIKNEALKTGQGVQVTRFLPGS